VVFYGVNPIYALFSFLKERAVLGEGGAANKALHSDKIKPRSLFTTLYFAGELGRYTFQIMRYE